MTRKAHKVDRDATAGREFSDARSYITIHGEEYLFGADLTARRRQVYEIYGGTCRTCCKAVSWEQFHMHHIKSKGRLGCDALENLCVLCPNCHAALHVRPMFTKKAERVA